MFLKPFSNVTNLTKHFANKKKSTERVYFLDSVVLFKKLIADVFAYRVSHH